MEACNCEAVCPCRRVGGRPGGRAQFQLCQFALAWTVDGGRFDDVDLAGLRTVMAGYWDEDKPGPNWKVQLYVDERADSAQQQALAEIFLGRAGGTPARNYGVAISEVYGVTPAAIEISHDTKAQRFRAGDAVLVAAREPFRTQEAVTCGIPGHDRPGQELLQETLRVSDGALDFEFHGRCGFASTFDYRS
ncbi:MAG TPA: DUF1326 domain-containing protein [Candidatus Dormibacteraeota bacterium]